MGRWEAGQNKMLPATLAYMKSKGFAVFTKGDYNLNIVGVRKRNGKPGKWDDALRVFWKRGAVWNSAQFECTVDPSLLYLNKRQLNVKGTAVLYGPAQYRGAFEKGMHKGKVLEEIGPFSAGCQVIRRANDWNYFMGLIDKSIEATGYDRFTYTLLDEWC